MLRVFERVWESAVAENEIEVWWKMVVHRSQIGPVVGKGGKNIKRVSSESGAQVRILPAPEWTVKDYELIQVRVRVLLAMGFRRNLFAYRERKRENESRSARRKRITFSISFLLILLFAFVRAPKGAYVPSVDLSLFS